MFDENSPGNVFFLNRGLLIYNRLVEHMRTQYLREYEEIASPLMFRSDLWRVSGHYDHYKQNMFRVETSGPRSCSSSPMNCPSALPRVQGQNTLLPRPPAALRRVHCHPPPGELRRAGRAHAAEHVPPGGGAGRCVRRRMTDTSSAARTRSRRRSASCSPSSNMCTRAWASATPSSSPRSRRTCHLTAPLSRSRSGSPRSGPKQRRR